MVIHHLEGSIGQPGGMAEISSAYGVRLRTDVVSWYVGGDPDAEAHEFAASSGGVVLARNAGFSAGRRLRRMGWKGRLWLDPDTSKDVEPPSLFPNQRDWAELQREVGVDTLFTPGGWLTACDIPAMWAAIDRQAEWARKEGGAVVNLVAHWTWLTTGLDALVSRLSELDGAPVAIAFEDRGDPLARRGAVAGLIRLARSIPNLAVLRCDVGAIGAVANGAAHGSVGRTTTLRHVSTGAGGTRGPRYPSVFWPATMDWYLGPKLHRYATWDTQGALRCDLAGCDGRDLGRFGRVEDAAEARQHNRHALAALVAEVLKPSPGRRAGEFAQRCRDATKRSMELATAFKAPDLRPSPQIEAWSTTA
ncbi:MAG: hypothetical protein QOI51_326 [Nocardioidaceae bacterium]|nr:hypothetical protein [Nocardioidaceae bacterium]